MSILVFQHSPLCSPGRLGATLRDHAFRLDVRRLDLLGAPGVPTDLDNVQGVVSLGGPQNVGENHAWMSAEMALLREAHRRELPVIGVCLGHQLIAAALGGAVAKAATPEWGFPEVEVLPAGQTETMLAGIAWRSPQFSAHGCEVATPPSGAVVLARSAACRVQAFRVGMRTFGFQYHFECDRAMIEALARDDASDLSRCGTSLPDIAAQCDAKYPMFARLADRLCVNLATFCFPSLTRLTA